MGQTSTLSDPSCKHSIVTRIGAVTPASPRQWGKMTAHQMLCHLTDSFLGVMGEREISPALTPLPRSVVKWIALRAPFRWPKNVRTRPEVDQQIGGTPPGEFEPDRKKLLDSLERFLSTPQAERRPHPMMGHLTHDEWMRWGYLHADHHLRQFGV